MSRPVVDGILRTVAAVSAFFLRLLPGRVVLRVLGRLGWLVGRFCDTTIVPGRRAAAAGISLDSKAWGAAMGRTLAGALHDRIPVVVEGWGLAASAAEGRGVLVLGAHLGPWEACAAELARRGRPPLVIAAPWPRLPRSEAFLASLRARRGVTSIARSRAAFRTATRRLRSGGTVVVLIDGVSAFRSGRRAVPWIGGSLASPGSLIRWAQRQGAVVWIAEGTEEGVRLHSGADDGDTTVALLASAIRRSPHAWAWVRPLACLLLMVGVGCGSPQVEPFPLAAEAWALDVQDVAWEGEIEGRAARLFAESAVVRWVAGGPRGRFERVELTAPRTDGEPSTVRIEADEARGAWPAGPMELLAVRWEADDRRGKVARLTYSGDGWSCGGCPLESMLGGG